MIHQVAALIDDFAFHQIALVFVALHHSAVYYCSELSQLVDCLSKHEFDSLSVKPVLEHTAMQFLSRRQRPLPHIT